MKASDAFAVYSTHAQVGLLLAEFERRAPGRGDAVSQHERLLWEVASESLKAVGRALEDLLDASYPDRDQHCTTRIRGSRLCQRENDQSGEVVSTRILKTRREGMKS